jgi:hypothetical protein
MNPIGSPTNFPQGFANGLSVRGMPLLQMQPGQVFFLGNGGILQANQKVGADGNRGTFLDPFGTLNYAVNTACTPGRGDIVFVLPGHQETISSAAIATLNTSGVAVIGLGAGVLRPTFTFTTATSANIPVYGASISLQNCLFVANFLSVSSAFTAQSASFTGVVASNILTASAVTGTIQVGGTIAGVGVTPGTVVQQQLTGTAGAAGTYAVSGAATVASVSMTMDAKDFVIDNCEFRDTSSILSFLSLFTTSSTANSADGFQMTRTTWEGLGLVSPTVAITCSATQDRWVLADNVMNSPITTTIQGPILAAVGANNLTNVTIARNRCQRPNTSSTIPCGISTSGTAWSGHAYDNYFGAVPTGTGVWINTGTKLSFTNNYSQVTGAADKSALINPVAV